MYWILFENCCFFTQNTEIIKIFLFDVVMGRVNTQINQRNRKKKSTKIIILKPDYEISRQYKNNGQ